MNTIVRVGQQVVSYDAEATKAFYSSSLASAGADEYGCAYCKNFAAQRTKAYPSDFVDFLILLGADPLKELEAFDYDFGESNSANHLYGGWFVLSGEIVEGHSWRPELRDETFGYWFTASFPSGGLPKDTRFFAVEFLTRLPWTLSEMTEQTDDRHGSRQ